MGHLIGIDLGTSNTSVACLRDGRRSCVPLETFPGAAPTLLPSCIAIDDDGIPVVGARARSEKDRVREFKRGVGTGAEYRLGDRSWSALELQTLLLKTVKDRFEAAVGPIEGAVITVPANFLDAQRREVREAGERAGLRVLRIINEPSAAAVAYSLSERPPRGLAVVVDWGGGTLDVSLLDCDDDVLDVKASDGDPLCGGRDVDQALVDLLLERHPRELGSVAASDDLREELAVLCERAKVALSDRVDYEFEVDLGPPVPVFRTRLTRADVETAASPFVERVIGAVLRTLSKSPDGAVLPAKVGDVLFVGGACRLPLLRRRIAEVFGKPGRDDVDPMEAVALGAAYQAEHARKAGDLIVLHSLATNLGVRCSGVDRHGVSRDDLFSVLIPATTKIPARATESYRTIRDDQDAIDIAVYEGEGTTIERCRLLEQRRITGLPSARQGEAEIKITFSYDVEQILHVVVEIPLHGIRREWRLAKSAELEAGRGAAEEKLRGLGSATGPAAFAAYAARVRAALPADGAPLSRKLLAEFEAAVGAADWESARSIRERLAVALYDEGVAFA